MSLYEWVKRAGDQTLEDKLREMDQHAGLAKPRDADHIEAIRSAILNELHRSVG